MKKLFLLFLVTLSFGQTPIKNRAIYTDTVRAWLNSGTTFPGAVNFTGLGTIARKPNLHLGADNKTYKATDTSGLTSTDSTSFRTFSDSLYARKHSSNIFTQTNYMAALSLSGAITGATSQSVFNTVSTTVNAFGAATALTLGATTGTTTVRNATTNFSGSGGSDATLGLWENAAGAYLPIGTNDGSFTFGGYNLENLTSIDGLGAGGVISGFIWNGTEIATTKGGTGLTSFTQGDLIYSSAANTLSKLAKDANATRYLSNTGTSNNPAWAQVNLTNGVTGTLPFGNLDTLTRNLSLATDNDRIRDSVLMATKLFIVDSTIVGAGYGLDRTVVSHTQTLTVDTTNEIATLYDVSQVSGSAMTKAQMEDTLNNTGVNATIALTGQTVSANTFLASDSVRATKSLRTGLSNVTDGVLNFYNATNAFYSQIALSTPSANRTLSLPNVSGTLLTLDGGQNATNLGTITASGAIDFDGVYSTVISTKANVAIGPDGKLRLAQDTTSSGGNPTKAVLVDTLNNTGVTSSIDFSSNIVTMAAGIFDSMKTNIANDQYSKNWQYRITTLDTTRDPVIDSIAHELTFALDAASLYEFEYQLYFTNSDASNATGVEVLATCASAPTTITGMFSGPLNAGVGTGLLSHDIQNSNADTVRTLSVFTNLTPMPHVYIGRILTNAATALNFSFQPEETSGTVLATLKRGSYGKIRKLYP